MFHNKAMDGLRGIAALSVAVLHFLKAFAPDVADSVYPSSQLMRSGIWYDLFTFPLFQLVYNSQLAVMIFFVLSGYVMALPFYRNDMAALKQRIWSRYLRLNLPIGVAVLVSFFFAKSGLYYASQAGALGAAEWLKNAFSMSHDYPLYSESDFSLLDAVGVALYRGVLYGNTTYVYVLWTLYFEFVGSLLLLFLYLVMPKRRIFAISAAASVLLWAKFGPPSIFFMALLAGSLLPNLPRVFADYRYVLLFLGLFFGAFRSGYAFYDQLPSPALGGVTFFDLYDFYKTLGAILIVAAVSQGAGHGILGSAAARRLGEVSYSLYLLHFIVLLSLSCFLFTVLPDSAFGLIVNFFAYIVVSLLAAYVFAKFIDRPAIEYSHRFARWIYGPTGYVSEAGRSSLKAEGVAVHR